MPKLMLNTGLRLSEATALRWKDIDLLTGKLIAQRGKGAKDRTLCGSGKTTSTSYATGGSAR